MEFKSKFNQLKNTLKKISAIFLFIIGSVCYFVWDYNVRRSNFQALSNTGSLMKKDPWSIPYVIISIIVLYFIGKIPFFEGIQIGGKGIFSKNKKSTKKEIFSTLVFGIILFVFIIGFFIIMTP